jgi:hypothetical protein
MRGCTHIHGSQRALCTVFTRTNETYSIFGYFSVTRRSAQATTAEDRLEQLQKVIPATVFVKWYKNDREDHPDWRHIEIEDQVWYVAQLLRSSDLHY